MTTRDNSLTVHSLNYIDSLVVLQWRFIYVPKYLAFSPKTSGDHWNFCFDVNGVRKYNYYSLGRQRQVNESYFEWESHTMQVYPSLSNGKMCDLGLSYYCMALFLRVLSVFELVFHYVGYFNQIIFLEDM